MRTQTLLTIATLLTVIFAGCTGSGPKDVPPPSTTAPPPTISPDKGSITGVVTDSELAPISGVDVVLLQTEIPAVKTDQGGKFTFNELTPGTFKIVASKLGYESVGRSANAVAGEVTEVTLTLVPIRIDVAYPMNFTYDGFYNAGISVGGASLRPGYLAFEDTEKSIFPTPYTDGKKIMTIIDGMVWDSSAPLTASKFWLEVYPSPDAADPLEPDAIGKSPLMLRIDEPDLANKGTLEHWTWVISTIDTNDPATLVSVVVNQRFRLYSTLYYNQAAPEGFSPIPAP